MKIEFTNEQIVRIGGIIQAELDRRIVLLVPHSQTMPFNGPTVVECRTVREVILRDLTYTIQQELRKPVDIG